MPPIDRRTYFTIENAIAVLVLLGAIGAVWVTLETRAADTARRVTVVEQRQIEDRQEAKSDRAELKRTVKDTNDSVQLILRKLDAMEAVRKTDDRDARARDRR